RSGAIAALREVLRIRPDELSTQLQLADLLVSNGEAGAALELLGVVLKKEPANGTAHVIHAKALTRSGNLVAAQAELLPIAGANPNSADVQIAVGDLRVAQKDLLQA